MNNQFSAKHTKFSMTGVELWVVFILGFICMLTYIKYTTQSSDQINLRELLGASKQKNQDLNLDSNTISNLYADISKSEYNIRIDSIQKTFQACNRVQSFRNYFQAGSWRIEDKLNSKKPSWQLDLKTQNIIIDSKSIKEENEEFRFEAQKDLLNFIGKAYTVQYINTPEGTRQNYIIESAALDSNKAYGKVEVVLQCEGMQIVSNVGGVVTFQNGENTIQYKGLTVYDSSGRILPSSIKTIKSKNNIHLFADIKGATFPITIDPIIINGNPSNANKVLESNQVSAFLGNSITSAGDVNGDGYSDVIVGAPTYDNGQTDEGAAFIYHGSSNGVSSSYTRMLESNQASAQFGYSVSSAGDVNGDGYSDVIVGSFLYDNGQTDEGAMFVYHGSSSGVSSSYSKMFESNQAIAYFGIGVSSAGDVNADGYSDIIVGAYSYDNGQTNEGAAFVYHGSSSGVSNNYTSMLESNQASAQSGYSVFSAGDVNGDGYSDVIVGANRYDNIQTDEGAAFVYHGSSSGVSITYTSMLESNQASTQFGLSVSSAGDVNGDGYSDVIVGANGYDNGLTDEGAAFVFHGSSSGISSTYTSILESNQASADFGFSVSSAGDVNGDGYSDVIVGACSYDNGQTNEGAAFVYHGSSSGVSSNYTSMLESNQVSAFFGYSVSSAGDVNGDGYSDIIVGAYLYDNGQTNEGGSFVYQGSSSGVSSNYTSMLESNQASAQFGISVSSAGDVNGDGYSDIIVGAPSYDNGQFNEGAAFVYHGSSSGVSSTYSRMLESNMAGAYFGYSVSSAGDVNGDGYTDVVVGADSYNNGQADEGAAFVYHGSSSGVSSSYSRMFESNQVNAKLGRSVSSAGDVNGDGYSDVIIGANGYDNSQTDEGAAFVYHGSSSGISSSYSRMFESNQASANMGISVSSAGDVNGDGYSDVIVGANGYDNGQTDEGAAFVYHGSSSGALSSYSSILESNQASASLGFSVSTSGDVNGDGYSDIIVGANRYDNSQTDEGAAFVYHGSSSGVSNTYSSMLESNQASANLGFSVSSAGDVNGDGYSDVIVGALTYDNGQTDEGATFVYHGSSSGVSSAYSSMLESNQASAYFGIGVSSAGDVNGDGYSDVIVGSYLYDNGQTDEGATFVFQGNAGSAGSRRNLVIYNSGGSSLFLKYYNIGMFSESFLGKSKGKIVWETRGNGQAFSGQYSTSLTGSGNSFVDLGLSGLEIRQDINKLNGYVYNKIRARVEYPLITAITGQKYGPWTYVDVLSSGIQLFPLPIKVIDFNAKLNEDETVDINWFTEVLDEDVSTFSIERLNKGGGWKQISSELSPDIQGLIQYYSSKDLKPEAYNLYRLVKTSGADSGWKSDVRLVKFDKEQIKVYPIPASNTICINMLNKEDCLDSSKIQIIDQEGLDVMLDIKIIKFNENSIELDISEIKVGVYFVKINDYCTRFIKL